MYGILSLLGAVLGASRERENKIRQIRSLLSRSLYSMLGGGGGVGTKQLNRRRAGSDKCTARSITVAKKLLCVAWKDPAEMVPRM